MHDLGLCKDEIDKFTDRLPPWGHLYMSEEEMALFLLCQGFDDKIKDFIVDKIYYSKCINRVSASRLKDIIMHCGMIIRSYQEYIAFAKEWPQPGVSALNDEIREKINNLGGGLKLSDIGIIGMEVCLEKYADLGECKEI